MPTPSNKPPCAPASDDDTLLRHRRIWEQRPLVRAIYQELYSRMTAYLAHGVGPTLELGAGGGNFKEFHPETIASDITWCSWLDLVADAVQLPFAKAKLGNLVLFDVFHHLPFPVRALSEARRVLATGGRVILCEPYISWVSGPVYRLFHEEHTDTRVRPLDDSDDKPLFDVAGPWSSNQAVPTVLFWRDRDEFERRFPEFTIVRREAMSTFMYPLSGGFEKRPLLPRFAWPVAKRIEKWTAPLAKWIGYRCLVVLERRP